MRAGVKAAFGVPAGLAALFLTVACAGAPPQGSRAQPAASVDVAYALDVAAGGAAADEKRAPGFLVEPIASAATTCREAGGRLIAPAQPSVWAIDVDLDGKSEYLFDLGASVGCDGAPSLFSCGSLGCPRVLYEFRDGSWRSIGAIDAGDPEAVEVLIDPPRERYRDLRVGCASGEACDEFAFHVWTGTGYACERLEVRGHPVRVAGAEHGLRTLVRETEIRATPAADGPVLDRYDAGTEVALIGEATGAPYLYVSPCNACRSGFVEKSAVRDDLAGGR